MEENASIIIIFIFLDVIGHIVIVGPLEQIYIRQKLVYKRNLKNLKFEITYIGSIYLLIKIGRAHV